jgi:tetratricopeptide (TPR) repeat protein
MPILLTAMVPPAIAAYVLLVARRRKRPVRSGRLRAIELNNAGLLLANQGDWAGAIELYSQALKNDSGLSVTYRNRGTAYIHAGRLDDALADLDRAVAISPNEASAYLLRAQLRLLRKEYDESLADLDESLRCMPENVAVIRLHQGTVRVEMGQYDVAIELLTEALERGGHWAVARCQRGFAYLRRGDFQEAIADCDEAIRLSPNDPVPYNNRGVVFTKLGEYARAMTDLQTAQRLNPRHPNAYKNLAWIQATCPDASLRDGALAIANALRAVQLAGVAGSGSEWQEVLAAARAECGEFELAVRCQEEVLKRSPASSRAEQQARLELYRSGQPFREQPTRRPMHTETASV